MPINRHRWTRAAGSGSGGSGDVTGPASSTDNAVARFDGAGGKTLQDSAVTVSDVAAGAVTLATTAGNALTIKNTDPAAAAGASVAGDAIALTAGNAVASTDTAGAAAGGAVTITSGNAARLTSGNANGGNITLVTGTGIGTGVAGQVILPNGSTFASPSLVFSSETNTGFLRNGVVGGIEVAQGGVSVASVQALGVGLVSDKQLYWHASNVQQPADTGFVRSAAGIVRASNGSSGVGWISSASNVALNANFTNATATMANLTGLTVTLLASRKYTFRMILLCANSTAADGVKIDFDGGAGTATIFRQHTTIHDAALLTSLQTSALATDVTAATMTGDSIIECRGAFTVNAAGTFIPRAACNAATTGTLTVYAGSHLWIQDSTFA